MNETELGTSFGRTKFILFTGNGSFAYYTLHHIGFPGIHPLQKI
jgi:hypothetical protein